MAKSIFSILLIALALLIPNSSHAGPDNSVDTFVEQNIDHGYEILANKSISDEERRREFREFMLSLTDPRRIGIFTLGPYARSASKTELDDFVAAFADYAVATYEVRLAAYKHQSLRVTNTQERTASDIIVFANVVDPDRPNTQPIKAAFRVSKSADGRWIVIDMEVEGVWLALTERSDFTGFLQQHNGSIPALTADLKRMVTELRKRN